jgi:hypothetical protein
MLFVVEYNPYCLRKKHVLVIEATYNSVTGVIFRKRELRSESGDEGNQIQSRRALSSIFCQSKVPGALR